MKKLFQFFIRRKEPSGTGFSLTVPGLSQAGESPFLRWLVQFAILLLGMLGCAVSFLSGFRLTFDSAVPVWICLYSAAAVTVYSTAAWALWILIPGIPLVLWAFFFFDQLSIGLVSLINRIFVVMSLNSPWSFPTYVLPETEATLSEIRWMETWFLVDDSKFSKIYSAVICPLTDAAIVTNHLPNEKYRQYVLIQESGVFDSSTHQEKESQA